MNGIELINQERQRQIKVEGYTQEKDKQYAKKELFLAACCYFAAKIDRTIGGEDHDPNIPPAGWPWAAEYWKPTPDNRIKEVVKAGALFKAQFDLDGTGQSHIDLCADEIDRILRLEAENE